MSTNPDAFPLFWGELEPLPKSLFFQESMPAAKTRLELQAALECAAWCQRERKKGVPESIGDPVDNVLRPVHEKPLGPLDEIKWCDAGAYSSLIVIGGADGIRVEGDLFYATSANEQAWTITAGDTEMFVQVTANCRWSVDVVMKTTTEKDLSEAEQAVMVREAARFAADHLSLLPRYDARRVKEIKVTGSSPKGDEVMYAVNQSKSPSYDPFVNEAFRAVGVLM